MRIARRALRWLRWALTLALIVSIGRHLLAPARPRYGVTPWGEPTGLRVAPLSPAETAAATAREAELGWAAAGARTHHQSAVH